MNEFTTNFSKKPELVRLEHVEQEPWETTILATQEYLESEEEAIKLVASGIGQLKELGLSSDIFPVLGRIGNNEFPVKIRCY